MEPESRVLKKGDRITIAIDGVAFGGQGVGRYGELVVFVPYTVDGDEAIIEIKEVKKRYAQGTVKALSKPSPHRIEPRCTSFTRCGGCQYQQMDYGHQLAVKTRQVGDAFARIGKFDQVPLAEIIPSPDAWHYRGKVEFHLGTGEKEEPVIGFTRTASHAVEEIATCHIAAPSINDDLAKLREEIRGGVRMGDRKFVWSTEGSGEPVKGYVSRIVHGKELLVPRRGFFQANILLLDAFIDTVLSMSSLDGGQIVIDGYCGSGFFSVFLAGQAKRFYGIEASAEAVRAADLNLKRSGVKDAEFYVGDVGEILRGVFIKERKKADLLVVDPPRIGLEPEVLAAVAALRPARIVYISCNPATMARDIRFLADRGFTLKALQPLDMFPQTSHIEIVALLT